MKMSPVYRKGRVGGRGGCQGGEDWKGLALLTTFTTIPGALPLPPSLTLTPFFWGHPRPRQSRQVGTALFYEVNKAERVVEITWPERKMTSTYIFKG